MRIYPTAPVVSVGGVVLRGGQVLLIKRGQAPLKGVWSLPGGVVELGETLEAAVAREVREETGLRVDVGPVVGVLDRIERAGDGRVEYHYVILDYLCRVRDGELACGSDADDVRWLDVAAVADYGVTAKTAEFIERAVSMPFTAAL